MERLNSDIILEILYFLNARDIILFSNVNRKFHQISLDNRLWFHLFQEQYKKFNRLKLEYDSQIEYKVVYLSLFHQKYNLQFINFYKEFPFPKLRSRLEDVIWKTFFFAPLLICIFPMIILIEIYEFCFHQTKIYEYCKCDSCFRKLRKVGRSIEKR
jgi:hypothetical protein